MKTPAACLLDAARASTPDAPTGVARSGGAVVTYYRAREYGRRLHAVSAYDVGTSAVRVIDGPRSIVLPYLDALLSGCATRAECDAWIADAPTRAAAARATGARLAPGQVRA